MSWLGNDDAPPTRPSGRRSTARTPSASFSNRRGPQAPAPTPTDPSSVPKAILTQARTTGRLNLSDRDLAEIPEDVWALSEPEQPSGPVDFSKAGYSSPEFTELLRFTAANNLLTSLDPRIVSAFPQLTYLDLRNNRLSQLPLELGELEALSIVHLTSNAFDHIPAAILSLPALTELSMPANAISTIGPGIRQLQLLQTLDLSSNALTVLPEDLGSLFSLRTLNLSRNHLTHLPGRLLSRLTRLKTLRVSENPHLSSKDGDPIQEGPLILPALQTLEMHRCKAIRFERLQAPNLQELIFSNNSLISLGSTLCYSPALSVLDLRCNKLDALPLGLTCLSTLTRLDIGANEFRSLPPLLGLLEGTLDSLSWDGNPIRIVPRNGSGTSIVLKWLYARISNDESIEQEARAQAEQERATALQAQGEGGTQEARASTPTPIPTPPDQLTPEPKEITPEPEATNSPAPIAISIMEELTLVSGPPKPKGPVLQLDIPAQAHNTRTIDLAGKGLGDEKLGLTDAALPSDLPFLPSTLVLSRNSLTIPPPLLWGAGDGLVCLILSHNRLSSFPIPPKPLPLLRELDLGHNLITQWPTQEVAQAYPALTDLNLTRNRLSGPMPPGTFVLSTLTTLILRDNKVTTLDPEACTSLRTLDMANNELTSLPPRLGLCPNLRQVSVDGNRFRIPRRDILDRGSDALLEWLRARA